MTSSVQVPNEEAVVGTPPWQLGGMGGRAPPGHCVEFGGSGSGPGDFIQTMVEAGTDVTA